MPEVVGFGEIFRHASKPFGCRDVRLAISPRVELQGWLLCRGGGEQGARGALHPE
jgi:hypothetical protein